MQSPKYRYQNDASFHALVDLMVGHIEQCLYTPTEMREAAMLACIIHMEMKPLSTYRLPREVRDFLDGKLSI